MSEIEEAFPEVLPDHLVSGREEYFLLDDNILQLWEVKTSISEEYPDEVIPYNPKNGVPQTGLELVVPYRLASKNAQLEHKTVLPIGPQPGDPGQGLVQFNNNGLSFTPAIRAWLELAGQRQVGLSRRYERVSVEEPWDQSYALPNDGSDV